MRNREPLSPVHRRSKDRVEIGDDLHRSIRKRLNRILLKYRVPNLFDSIEVKLIGEVSTDGIGVRRVFSRLADVIDRGLAGAATSEGLIELLCWDFCTVCKIYRQLLVETADDKINQMLLFNLLVCLVFPTHYIHTDTSSNPM